MTSVIMDGRAVAAMLKEGLRTEVAVFRRQGIQPKLTTILVGNDLASKTYLAAKHRACSELDIASENFTLPHDSSASAMGQLIDRLNHDHEVHGILLQLPLPPHLDGWRMLETIISTKDVDGLHPQNLGRLMSGRGALVPCTPKGVVALLKHYGVGMKGAKVAIVNRSLLVGKPLAHLFLAEDATVHVCHSQTRNLAEVTREADIVVSAVGRRPTFTMTADMVREGAAVVDVAVNRVDGGLCGDVDFPGVATKAAFLTPVPGGVGPMTVAMLMQNTLIATALNTNLLNRTMLGG
jgi:methylenetetrahydrofolate dehydrogenase (NADP+)/methenyltetrahydrofolate cyclohydrolase